MSTINAQTPGRMIAVFHGNGKWGLGSESRQGVIGSRDPWRGHEVESDANGRLLAAAYTAFDKAGRALGVDAATLAESIDLAGLRR